MPETKRWIVTTSGDRPLGDVEKSLTDAGFTVEETLEAIGCVIGTQSDENDTDQLRAIPGVADVSPEEIISIGPPDADPTW